MASYWQFNDQGLGQTDVGNAPTYKDVFTKFAGQDYMTGYDPALAMTLNAGGAGQVRSGIGAFLSAANNNEFQAGNNQILGGSRYALNDLQDLAKHFGVDPNSANLEADLENKLGDYYAIGGMSAGWNPTGDVRQGNATLYQRKDGQLVPIQTQGGHLREQGGYIQENPGILAPIAVATGGLAYGALAGAGTGAASGAAAAGSGAGATGAGTASGLSGMWAGLPTWGQGALTGAAQGGVSAGLQGKNILRGALMGGLTGGVGAVGGGLLSNATGLPGWASRAVVSSGLGGLNGGWKGALGAGLGSLASTGLGEMGLPSGLASRLGGMLGNFGAGSLLGGSGAPQGTRMGGGGSSGAPSTSAAGGSGLGGGIGTGSLGRLSGGLSGGRWKSVVPGREQAFLNETYAPIAQEENRKRLAQQLADEGVLT